MRTKLQAWPEGTAEYVGHSVIKDYIQETAKNAGVERLTHYGARVTRVEKKEDRWSLRYDTMRRDSFHEDDKTSQHELVRIDFETELLKADAEQTFDAVVVATGRYHTLGAGHPWTERMESCLAFPSLA